MPDESLLRSSSATPAIRIRALEKTYAAQGGQPPHRALQQVNLEIPQGSMFGLLGPNGAGKSTLINILGGLVIKNRGVVEIDGHNIDTAWRQARLSIGIMPQELVMDPFFTPREMLDLQAGLYGVPAGERITDRLLDIVGLSSKANVYARTLSGGMRRRLMIAKALAHRPPILILDEPTAGVDIELRQTLWREVRAINRAGATVLLTTHHFEEVEDMCDRIAIIDRGKLIMAGPIEQLMTQLNRKELVVRLTSPIETLPDILKEFDARLTDSHTLVIGFRPSDIGAGDILVRVRDAGLSIRDLSTEEPRLEDLFLQLTSRK